MRISAAASTCVSALIDGDLQAADWLGTGGRALYLITESGTVLAVLTHDATRLPCGVVLPTTAAELPLSRLAPTAAQRLHTGAVVGEGQIEWAGPDGPVTIATTRRWAPARLPSGTVDPAAVAELARILAERDIGIPLSFVDALGRAGHRTQAQSSAAQDLLGRGPGLTPSGDDVLAGLLIGARVLGFAVTGVERAVADRAAHCTTALSAQLLRYAARGECVDQLAAAGAALVGAIGTSGAATSSAPIAFARLLEVGHTSGAALAHGLAVAAELARSDANVVQTGGLK